MTAVHSSIRLHAVERRAMLNTRQRRTANQSFTNPGSDPMKILVVDDVGYTRHFHARLLEKHGHDAISAGSASDAIKALKTDHSVEVVLTDLMMSDMDGVELYQEVQKLERT